MESRGSLPNCARYKMRMMDNSIFFRDELNKFIDEL
jgi:hypothetical protein